MRTELTERGAVITHALDTHQAFEALAARDFAVVVVNPYVGGNGLDLVTALKEREPDHLHTVATLYGQRALTPFLRGARPPNQETLSAARARHRLTPFVILPRDESGSYAVVVVFPDAPLGEHPWALAALLRGAAGFNTSLPIVTAILTVDAGTLLGRAVNMA